MDRKGRSLLCESKGFYKRAFIHFWVFASICTSPSLFSWCLPGKLCISISHVLLCWEYKREWSVVSSFPATPSTATAQSPDVTKHPCWCCTHVLVDVWLSTMNVSQVMQSPRNWVSVHSFIILTVDLHFPPNLLERLSGITKLSFYCLARIQPGCLSHMNSNCMELP